MGILGVVSGTSLERTSVNAALAILLFICVYQFAAFLIIGPIWLSVCYAVSGGVLAFCLAGNQRAALSLPIRTFAVSLSWSILVLSAWMQHDVMLDWFYLVAFCAYLLFESKIANRINGLGMLALFGVLIVHSELGKATVHLLPLAIMAGLASHVNVRLAYLNNALKSSHTIDSLTGCANRRYLQPQMSKAVDFRRRYQVSMSAVALKVNEMQDQIERIGHDKFDALLVELTQVWKSRLRNTDTLCRYSDNIFIALLPSTSSDNASLLAQDLVKASEAYEYNACKHVSISYRVVEHDGIESWEAWCNKLIGDN